MANATKDPSDTLIQGSANDTVSSLWFNPVHDFLVSSSWDNTARLFQVSMQGQAIQKGQWEHQGPVLDCYWSQDGTKAFSASADKTIKMLDANTMQSTVIGNHDAPVKNVRFIPNYNLVVSGSWDKTLKFWDTRTPTAALTIPLTERVYDMDVKFPLLAVGTADQNITLFNLQSLPNPFKSGPSPLKSQQTRSICAMNEAMGYILGTTEARCAIEFIDDEKAKASGSGSFSFKCHREGTQTGNMFKSYAVNSVRIHPNGTFVTAGSDGTYTFWDREIKQRLRSYQANVMVATPVTATAYDRTGNLFAYATGYDWSKGHEYNTGDLQYGIFLHKLVNDDVKANKPQQQPRRK